MPDHGTIGRDAYVLTFQNEEASPNPKIRHKFLQILRRHIVGRYYLTSSNQSDNPLISS